MKQTSQQEQFYGTLNNILIGIVLSILFTFVYFVVKIILNVLYYIPKNSIAPFWVVLPITAGIFIIGYFIKNRKNLKFKSKEQDKDCPRFF